MPVDTSIYGNLLRPAPTLTDNIASLDQADMQRSQAQSAKLNLIGQQQSLADDQAVRAIYSRPNFNPLDPTNLPSIFAASPKAGAVAQKAQLEAQQTQATTAKANADALKATTEATGMSDQQKVARTNQHLQQLVTVSDVPGAVSWINSAVGSGELPMQQATQVIGALQSGQLQLGDWKQKAMAGGLTLQQQRDNARLEAAQAETARHNQASEADTRRGQNITQQTQYTIAGLDRNGKDASGGTGGLSPAAIENAATRYNVDGTLPPQLGRGAQGARDIRAIQNRAAELAMGTDPAQLRVNQLDAKSASTALSQLTKSATMAAAFENTANQNADLALSLSKKNDRTGIPMLNAGLQSWRKGTGSPEATQFAAANETFVNEYAKIMSGGMGNAATSDAASKRAHDLLSEGMTDGQYEGNVRLLQQEMRNRMKGYDDQTAALKARIGGRSAPSPAGDDADLHAKADAILRGSK